MTKDSIGQTDTAQGPSAWVLRWLGRPTGGATLLDFASGSGRHVGPAVAAGYQVLAADRDEVALRRAAAAGAEILTADLEGAPWSFDGRRFEVVLMSRYLHRARLDLLLGLVAPGGRFLGETFGRGNARWGRPRSPAFLLEPDELFLACRRAGLRVLAFEQGLVPGLQSAPSVVQRVVAIRPPYDPLAWPLEAIAVDSEPIAGREAAREGLGRVTAGQQAGNKPAGE